MEIMRTYCKPTPKALRSLKGTRIRSVLLNAFRDGRGSWAHDPTIELEDGTILHFVIHETDAEENGIDLRILRAKDE
jgi:hypothetical protein